MKCFYHSSDLDGHCSGAIVRYFKPECELIGINYGDEFPWDTIEKGEAIFMVDFSLQPFSDMIKLNDMCDLVWIDHHISAIKECEKSKTHITGVTGDGIGACQLTWNYLTYKPLPKIVRLLSEYDVWNHSHMSTLPLQFGIRTEKTKPEESMTSWSNWFYEFPMSIVNKGEIILKYNESENKKYCAACSFETELDGLKCIAINKMLTNSQIFESVWDSEKYDAMLTFGWRKGRWTVSLYTDKDGVDVSIFAKNRGGGGHVGAAGFQCEALPFL